MTLSPIVALFINHEEVYLPEQRSHAFIVGGSTAGLHEFGSRAAHRLISDERAYGHNLFVLQSLTHTLQGQNRADAGDGIAGTNEDNVFFFQQIQESLTGKGGVQTRKKEG